jgi:hypothetical protein
MSFDEADRGLRCAAQELGLRALAKEGAAHVSAESSEGRWQQPNSIGTHYPLSSRLGHARRQSRQRANAHRGLDSYPARYVPKLGLDRLTDARCDHMSVAETSGRVMDQQRDLVEVVAELKQVVCVKG